jgi:hypothetical protein
MKISNFEMVKFIKHINDIYIYNTYINIYCTRRRRRVSLFFVSLYISYHLTTHIYPNLMSQYDEPKKRTCERVILINLIYRLHFFFFVERQMSLILLLNNKYTRHHHHFVEQGSTVYMSIKRRFLSFETQSIFSYCLPNRIESIIFSLFLCFFL